MVMAERCGVKTRTLDFLHSSLCQWRSRRKTSSITNLAPQPFANKSLLPKNLELETQPGRALLAAHCCTLSSATDTCIASCVKRDKQPPRPTLKHQNRFNLSQSQPLSSSAYGTPAIVCSWLAEAHSTCRSRSRNSMPLSTHSTMEKVKL